ncbi:hypothetical protein FSP39_021295 [Pinctada imbricata]|uniref:Potassium channel tetramerisation-type BTB domain-containing protein n=1 Tax=Pinctada imbricata TaxID=66713 RepID=A0AA89BVG3_PINIB|nr:hypothetical protein FSP39_021295 [Pinctada imbricata]
MEAHSGFKWRCTGCDELFTRSSTTHKCDGRKHTMECYKEVMVDDMRSSVCGAPAKELYEKYREEKLPQTVTYLYRQRVQGKKRMRSLSPSPPPVSPVPQPVSPVPPTPEKISKKAETTRSALDPSQYSDVSDEEMIEGAESGSGSLPPSPQITLEDVRNVVCENSGESQENQETDVGQQNQREPQESVSNHEAPALGSESQPCTSLTSVSTPGDAPSTSSETIKAKSNDGESESESCASDCEECERKAQAAMPRVVRAAKDILNYQDRVIKLNVGGKEFMTTQDSLIREKDTIFHHMMNLPQRPKEATFFIDRDPKYFHLILNYLRRNGNFKKALLPREPKDLEEMLLEVEYYNLGELGKLIRKRMEH